MCSKNNINQSEEISGFPELTLQEEIVMQKIIQQIKIVYESFGYNPMETRLIESLSVLLEKGIDGKEVFILDKLHKGEIKEKSEKLAMVAIRSREETWMLKLIWMYVLICLNGLVILAKSPGMRTMAMRTSLPISSQRMPGQPIQSMPAI